mmetsp:Transcript_30700/g.48126  ORF Transcript_30700/g.48126 Transcript_30700/m.48126 type:complete len:950 (+) Transcript_30700:85-2934(+)
MPRDLLRGDFGPPDAIANPLQINFVSLADFRDHEPNLPSEYFAVVYQGNLTIQEAGTYTFRARSDDGSLVFIDEVQAIDNDGAHSALDKTTDKYMSQGVHEIRIEMFERTGDQVMSFFYDGPDTYSRELAVACSVDVTKLRWNTQTSSTTPVPTTTNSPTSTTTTSGPLPTSTPIPTNTTSLDETTTANTDSTTPPPQETPSTKCPTGFVQISWEKAEDKGLDPGPRLLAYWPLSDDLLDRSGNGYHLDVPQGNANIHGVTFEPDSVMPAGLAGSRYADFGSDGLGALQVVKQGGFHGFSSSFSIEYWIKTHNRQDDAWSVVSYCQGYPVGHHLLTSGGNLSPQKSCRVMLFGTSHSFAGSACDSNGVSDGAWHHIAYVRHGTSLALYVDGDFVSLAAQTSITTRLQDGGSLVLGQDQDSCGQGVYGGVFDTTKALKGGVTEVRIWQGALSKEMIRESMAKRFHMSNSTCSRPCHEHAGCVDGNCTCLPGFHDRDSASVGSAYQGVDCVETLHCDEDLITAPCDAGLFGIPPYDSDNAMPRLIGYWPLSDDLLDKSGRDNHLVVPSKGSLNAPTFVAGGLPTGLTGGYADFGTDGNGGLEVSKVGGFKGLTGSFTIEYWIKINTISDSAWSVVSYCRGYSWGNHLLTSGGNANQWKDCRIMIFGSSYSFPGSLCSSSGVSNGAWHHVAYVRSGTSVSLYIDGDYKASVTVTAQLQDGGSLVLGQDQDSCEDGGGGGGFESSQALEGALTEVRIWQGARTAQEINATMRARFWADGGRCEGTHPCHKFAGCDDVDNASIICSCLPGYKDRDPLSVGNPTQGIDCVELHLCTTCLPDHYCPANTTEAKGCPLLSTSPAGSDSIEDCKCAFGTFFEEETFKSCLACPSGYYCPGASAGRLICPPGSNYCPMGSGQPSTCLSGSICTQDLSEQNHPHSVLALDDWSDDVLVIP